MHIYICKLSCQNIVEYLLSYIYTSWLNLRDKLCSIWVIFSVIFGSFQFLNKGLKRFSNMNDLNASKIGDNKEICTVLVPAIISKLNRYRIFICILNRKIKEITK